MTNKLLFIGKDMEHECKQTRLNYMYNKDDYKDIICFHFNECHNLHDNDNDEDEERLESRKQILQNDTWKYSVGFGESGDDTWQYARGDDYYDYYKFYDYSNGFDLATAKYVQLSCVFRKPVMKIRLSRDNRGYSDFCHFHFGDFKSDYYELSEYFTKYASVDFDTKNPFGFTYTKKIVENELKDLLEEKTKNNIVHEEYPYITYSKFQKDKCGYVTFSFDAFYAFEDNYDKYIYFTNDAIVYYAILATDEEDYLACIEDLQEKIVYERKTLKEKNPDDIFFDVQEKELSDEQYLEESFVQAFNLKEKGVNVYASAYRTHYYDDYCYAPREELIDADEYTIIDDCDLRDYLDNTDVGYGRYEVGYDKEDDIVKFEYDSIVEGFSYTLDARFNFEKNKDVLPKVLVDAIMEIKEENKE